MDNRTLQTYRRLLNETGTVAVVQEDFVALLDELERLQDIVDRRDACSHGIVTECRECGYARFLGNEESAGE